MGGPGGPLPAGSLLQAMIIDKEGYTIKNQMEERYEVVAGECGRIKAQEGSKADAERTNDLAVVCNFQRCFACIVLALHIRACRKFLKM